MRRQRNGKYSCIECERRFLVSQLPAEFQHGEEYRTIVDHYIPGSRLRLRRVEASSGAQVVFKLTQKFADASSLTGRSTILTTFYLNEAEYRCLAVLGGDEITKRRYGYVYAGHTWAFDVFTGRHEGLMLAEVEDETEDILEHVAVPPFVGLEVTNDLFFTGGSLAVVPIAELQRIIAEHLSLATEQGIAYDPRS